ncbi:hypothetical protein ONZ45_g6364 [Pleurotus djamor]|nr:hypothetical protein ONZ45_g6364 [Pleurotus djamor]
MNSSMIPTCLKRQPRIRTRKSTSSRSSPTRGQALHMIPELSEEEEPSSPASVKARRRHAHLKLSDIRIAKDILVFQDVIPSDEYESLSSPRPAPSPPTSPSALLIDYASSPSPSSSRSRSLSPCNSAEMSYRPKSSPTIESDSSVSPASENASLPPTPTSDTEFFASSSRVCDSVRPLTIAKLHSSPQSYHDEPYDFDISVYETPELRQPFKNEQERHLHSDYDSTSPIHSESDSSDSEEAGDWYAREFSNILSLYSPAPRMSLAPIPEDPSLMSPTSPDRVPNSTPLILSNAEVSLPDPHHLPPVPAIPAHLRNLRPPPRMSVPSDFDFSLSEDDSDLFTSPAIHVTASPSISSFSYSSSSPSSSSSFYSGESGDCDVEFDVDVQFELEMDQPMCLPLSLPSTPIDLEADITNAFEELRSTVDASQPQPKHRPSHLQLSSSAINHSTPSDLLASDEVTLGTGGRVLRSRWSSSTLSSTYSSQEELNRSSLLSPSKLRFYFSGSKSKKASRGRKSSGAGVSSLPPTPMVPVTPRTPSASRTQHVRGGSKESTSSDVGHSSRPSSGVRRRPSTGTCSIAGSDSGCSDCSSSSNGLRRKPIPIEMFLRNN